MTEPGRMLPPLDHGRRWLIVVASPREASAVLEDRGELMRSVPEWTLLEQDRFARGGMRRAM